MGKAGGSRSIGIIDARRGDWLCLERDEPRGCRRSIAPSFNRIQNRVAPFPRGRDHGLSHEKIV